MTKAKQTPPVALYAGIDIGAESLILVIRKNGIAEKAQKLANTPAERRRLTQKLAKLPGLIACLEATGVYYLDLAVALNDAGVKLMVLNPKAAHNFSKVLLRNTKTDAVDGDTLAQYAERMPFVAWARPSDAALIVRAYARRLYALTRSRAAAKNQLHGLTFSPATPKAVVRDVKAGIAQLDKRIDCLAKEALTLLRGDPQLNGRLALLLSIKGIGETSAIALLGELLLLPQGLTHKQWVKYAGLDPRHFQSGKSIDKSPRLSKAGNRYIRQALYMPALSAKTHDRHVKAYFDHLLDNGKQPLQAVCAVMRKLLHAIHGMFEHDKPFDNTRFYALPA